MSRKKRIDYPGTLHHIIVRGINKGNIFQDDQDKIEFLNRLFTRIRINNNRDREVFKNKQTRCIKGKRKREKFNGKIWD